MAKKKTVKSAGKRSLRKPNDAISVIDRRYYEGNTKRKTALEKARADEEVGRKIYNLRTQSGLTQQELAKMVGTTKSVICRLEDADYKGHSLPMLRRIAAALDKRVEIRFVSIGSKVKTA